MSRIQRRSRARLVIAMVAFAALGLFSGHAGHATTTASAAHTVVADVLPPMFSATQ